MARPPVIPVEDKLRIVLSVLAGEMTIAEAARRNKVSENSVSRWKQQFIEGGRAGLAEGSRAGSENPRERVLLAEIEELKAALGEAHVELRVGGEVGGVPAGPFEDLEMIRVEAGMPTSRFCALVGVPERTYRRVSGQGPPRGPAAGPLVGAGARADRAGRGRGARPSGRLGGIARSPPCCAPTASPAPIPRCCGRCAPAAWRCR